jgi:hypothetical protein
MRRFALAISLGVLLTSVAALGGARSVRVTSEDLHRGGGVPPGWKFTVPPGDPDKGKQVFAALECYSCHEVTGADFPAKATDRSGPDLTRMGAHHPAEYFAESLLDPDAVIIDAPGFYDENGRSTMPSYNDSLTLEQWVNLVAYLKSLTGATGPGHHAGSATPAPEASHAHGAPDEHAGHHGPPAPAPAAPADGHGAHGMHEAEAVEHEKIVGEYRVRLDYEAPGDGRSSGRLTVWVSDDETGHPVPYLPVEVRIGDAPRAVELRPEIGPDGPQYGAAVTIPDATVSVRVSLGPATARVAGPVSGKYRSPRQVSFDW